MEDALEPFGVQKPSSEGGTKKKPQGVAHRNSQISPDPEVHEQPKVVRCDPSSRNQDEILGQVQPNT